MHPDHIIIEKYLMLVKGCFASIGIIVKLGDFMVGFAASEDGIVHGPGRVTEMENKILELLKIDSGYTCSDINKKMKFGRKMYRHVL